MFQHFFNNGMTSCKIMRKPLEIFNTNDKSFTLMFFCTRFTQAFFNFTIVEGIERCVWLWKEPAGFLKLDLQSMHDGVDVLGGPILLSLRARGLSALHLSSVYALSTFKS